jgi:hypothetical protein
MFVYYYQTAFKGLTDKWIDFVFALAEVIFTFLVHTLTFGRLKIDVVVNVESRKRVREREELYEEVETFLNACVRKEKKV